MRGTKSVFRIVAVLSAALALILLVDAGPASAATAKATGNWIDLTMYCGSGICVPYGANHKSYAYVNYYWPGITAVPHTVYWQQFGGLLTPKSSFCGTYDWVKRSTYYVTSSGNVTIGGWVSTGALCNSNEVCKNYFSNTDYGFRCNPCKGKFQSATWFTSRCLPNMITHTTTVSF